LAGSNPLLGGLASGKYEREAAGSEQQASIEKGSRFDKNARQGQMYRARYFKEAYFDAIDLLKRAAETHGLTLPETVLRWVQHHSILKPDFGDAT
jgi:aflatoxin B1 aldehyde reductase